MMQVEMEKRTWEVDDMSPYLTMTVLLICWLWLGIRCRA